MLLLLLFLLKTNAIWLLLIIMPNKQIRAGGASLLPVEVVWHYNQVVDMEGLESIKFSSAKFES